ncbi:MAG: hypothetical protein AAF642_04365 [Pseudomonadota bacterium]
MIRFCIAILIAIIGFGMAPRTVAQAEPLNPTVVSAKPDEVSITVYPGDLAMITERRTISVPAGRSRISFEGINDRIIPQTALLTEFGAISIERNFDYELLSRQALLENSVGQEVSLIRTLPGDADVKVEQAVIASSSNGVVLRVGDRLESFQCSGVAERVEFNDVPEALTSNPTLSLTIVAPKAGPQTVEVRYLATGFAWRADYIMSLQKRTSAQLDAWLTISNLSRIDVTNADISVVGGTLSRLAETSGPQIIPPRFFANCHPRTQQILDSVSRNSPVQNRRMERVIVTSSRLASESDDFARARAQREDLGNYKLYRAPFRTTLAAQQTKQILFLNKPRVRYKKRYAFDFTDSNKRDALNRALARPDSSDVLHGEVRYVVDNSRRGRLAEPLPAGIVRVMAKRANDALFFAGADEIENHPIGRPVEVDSGFSNQVVLIPQTLSFEPARSVRGDPMTLRQEHYTFINTSPKRVEVEFSLLLEPGEKISKASIRPKETRPSTTWRLMVPADETRALTFEFLTF